MKQQNKPDKAPLDEVMMAMDVVDTLRHQKLLVDRELNSDEREKNLIKRLRKIYAAQGIDVPDSILEEGVKALEDDRFTYVPPAPGFQTKLANLYIERGKWAKRSGLFGVLILIIWGGWYGMVTLPEQHRISAAASEFNGQVSDSKASLQQTEQKLSALRESLKKALTDSSGKFVDTAKRVGRQVSKTLDGAETAIDAAKALPPLPLLTVHNYAQQSVVVDRTRTQLLQLIGEANKALSTAEQRINGILRLADLPDELSAERDAIKKIAREQAAKKQADLYFENAMAGLLAGDIDVAVSGYRKLQALRHDLASSYLLRVVVRPGERSGVWRVPKDNQGAKNYYLVVEAIDAAGNSLTLPVTNEEDGKIYSVNKWGLRVPHSVYQRGAADKQDDGIIQKRRIGSKKVAI